MEELFAPGINLANHQDTFPFSRMLTKRKHQKNKDIVWIVHCVIFVQIGKII